MSCPLCGKPQGPKCEGGMVRYIAGLFPCALKVGNLRVIESVPVENIYVIEPGSAGLEDLL